jgi:hypothetical protein
MHEFFGTLGKAMLKRSFYSSKLAANLRKALRRGEIDEDKTRRFLSRLHPILL